jgi:hypothetical protein
MVKGILADINIQRQVRIMVQLLATDPWRDVWEDLNFPLRNFADFNLPRNAPDVLIWEVCQREQLVLLTDNRNAEGPDSLEETIRTRNQPDSLPVFTVANAQHFLHSRAYAERVVWRFLEYLLDMDKNRGTGRLYLP